MSHFSEIIYAIIPTADMDTEKENMIKVSTHACLTSLLKSNDGLKTVVSFSHEFCAPFSKYTWYNKLEMQAEIKKEEWPQGE